MEKNGRKPGLLRTLAEGVRRNQETLRQAEPNRFVTAQDGHLFVENVAHLLGCSVDFVRRIPRNELPAAKPGKRIIYLRDDVTNYLRLRRDVGITGKLSSGERAKAPDTSQGFDPVLFVRPPTKRGAKRK